MRDCEKLLHRKVEDYRWLPTTGPISMRHYDDTIAEMKDRSQNIPGILAMYDLGPIRYPGLSDIDLLFVVDDEFNNYANLRALSRAAFEQQYYDVLLHDPYFIRNCDLQNLFHFAPIFQIRSIWGTKDFPHSLVNSDLLDLTLFLMDIIAESYPREFIKFLLLPSIDERDLVGRLKGLTYCFKLLAMCAEVRQGSFEAYTASIDEMRSAFFSTTENKRQRILLRLTKEAVTLSHQLAVVTSRALADSWELRVEGLLELFCNSTPTFYVDKIPESPRFGTLRLGRLEVYTMAPVAFGWLVREYAGELGPFSDRLRSNMSDNLRSKSVSSQLAQATRMRARFRNSHIDWLNSSRMGFYGFLQSFYPLCKGLPLNWLKYNADRVVGHAREMMLQHRMEKELSALTRSTVG